MCTGLGQAFSKPGAHFPVSPEDTAQMTASVAMIPRLIEQGRLKPNPVKLLSGGLAAILEGLKYLEEGKASGEKVVVVL